MHQEFLRHLLRYKADTLNDVVNVIGGALFAECFIPWVEGLREPAPALTTSPEVIAIEGKILRRTHSRNRDRGPPHLLSAWASSKRFVLGQQACQAKFNEITAFPPLLLDAWHSPARWSPSAPWDARPRSPKPFSTGGDYLLAVKDNEACVHDEIRRYLDDLSRLRSGAGPQNAKGQALP